jgi:16S rRNA (cytidine1402-2'-O)-methyltransferase
MATLFLVATPIGNLEDLTFRARKILEQVPLIAAEDTRHTGRLLAHYGIQTPLTSYHDFSKPGKKDRLMEALSQGDLALVSDAGTPALNDPGFDLVRAALEAGHQVSPIPGPSAPVSALVASGLPTDAYLYLGYLPRKRGERRRMLQSVERLPYTLIFLETPHRLVAALQDLEDVLGDRRAAVARELTKLHEEFFRGVLSAARMHYDEHPPRGEITLVVAGYEEDMAARWPEARLRARLLADLGRPEPASQIAREVSQESGWPRRQVYKMLSAMERGGAGTNRSEVENIGEGDAEP